MGQLLSNLANGSLVKLNENGEPKKFIKLDTDHYGDGTGCTMLRKDVTGFSNWGDGYNYGGVNYYPSSVVDNFCDSIFLQRLSDEIRNCIISTPITVSAGYISKTTMLTIHRKGFALSCTEVGVSADSTEGTKFSYLSEDSKRVAILCGTTVSTRWWLRSPYTSDGGSYMVFIIEKSGGRSNIPMAMNGMSGTRPAFNLRSDIVVSDTTDSDGCYTVESIPAKSGGGVYVKQNGVWVQAL